MPGTPSRPSHAATSASQLAGTKPTLVAYSSSSHHISSGDVREGHPENAAITVERSAGPPVLSAGSGYRLGMLCFSAISAKSDSIDFLLQSRERKDGFFDVVREHDLAPVVMVSRRIGVNVPVFDMSPQEDIFCLAFSLDGVGQRKCSSQLTYWAAGQHDESFRKWNRRRKFGAIFDGYGVLTAVTKGA